MHLLALSGLTTKQLFLTGMAARWGERARARSTDTRRLAFQFQDILLKLIAEITGIKDSRHEKPDILREKAIMATFIKHSQVLETTLSCIPLLSLLHS